MNRNCITKYLISMLLVCLMNTVIHVNGSIAEDAIDQIIELRKSSLCKIAAYESNSISSGSGVYIGSNYVITAKHVVQQSKQIVCTFDTGEQIKSIGCFDSIRDQSIIALASIPQGITSAPIAANDPMPGSSVYLAGFDNGNRLRFYSTTISDSSRFNYGYGSEAFAPAISGNSGGPVFNSAGQFIGTLWGTDGRTTSITNNRATHEFFRQVAQRYPAFGNCYRNACPPIKQPIVPAPLPVTPLEPAPGVLQKQGKCDCDIEKLSKLLEQMLSSQQSKQIDMQAEIARYLENDPLTITLKIRDSSGNILEGGTDVAKVVPFSQLSEQQKNLVRDSLQLQPDR